MEWFTIFLAILVLVLAGATLPPDVLSDIMPALVVAVAVLLLTIVLSMRRRA